MAKSKEKVAFTLDNAKRCLCASKCPVQSDSKCTKKLMAKLMVTLQKPGFTPKPKDMPRLFCSVGKASCKDLDTKKACICTTCPVFADFKLASGKPVGYYCRDGKAM